MPRHTPVSLVHTAHTPKGRCVAVEGTSSVKGVGERKSRGALGKQQSQALQLSKDIRPLH